MKRNFDTVVVGGGLSGLMASIAAAESGQKVAVLTKGAGTLTIGGGVIDLLGCVDGKGVVSPFDAMDKLPESHPYKIIGKENIYKALNYFIDLTEAGGYAYKSCGEGNCWVPTAIGTLKPTYLIPRGADPHVLLNSKTITVLGIKGLKDFYAEFLVAGLRRHKAYADKAFEILTLEPPYHEGRDLSALDVARYVDSEAGRDWLVANLAEHQGAAVLMPPILGTRANYEMLDYMKTRLGISCFETPVMPPSVPGLRLRHVLMEKIKHLDVYTVELGEVVRAETDGKACKGVFTKAADGERLYTADKFIIATGGFFGGGCVAEPGKAYEAIFRIDLDAPKNQTDWSQPSLLGREPHLFASMGVKVNEKLQALDKAGNIIYENVHFVGRTMGGYDFAEEKCGNGVAVVSGYVAGRI